jgi:hypothetical protein
VTDDTEKPVEAVPVPPKSLPLPLLADSAALMRVRVLPAQAARVIGVSKQTMSRWISSGKVSINLDGRLDLQTAVEQILRTCDPGRMRSRVLRQAVGNVADLRAAVADLQAQLEKARADATYFEGYADDADRMAAAFLRGIKSIDPGVRADASAAAWEKIIAALELRAAELADGVADDLTQAAFEMAIDLPFSRAAPFSPTGEGE